MVCIDIDLENYKEEFKETFCENNQCLLNLVTKRGWKEKFKKYIDDLENDVYRRNYFPEPEKIIRDLKYLYEELL